MGKRQMSCRDKWSQQRFAEENQYIAARSTEKVRLTGEMLHLLCELLLSVPLPLLPLLPWSSVQLKQQNETASFIKRWAVIAQI